MFAWSEKRLHRILGALVLSVTDEIWKFRYLFMSTFRISSQVKYFIYMYDPRIDNSESIIPYQETDYQINNVVIIQLDMPFFTPLAIYQTQSAFIACMVDRSAIMIYNATNSTVIIYLVSH